MDRIDRLRRSFRRYRIDGILITDIYNVRYLSGFTGSSGAVLVTPDTQVFITDGRYREQAKNEVMGFEVLVTQDSLSNCVKKVLKKMGSALRRLGFEGDYLTYFQYIEFRRALSTSDFVECKDLVGELRQVKEADEVAKIKRAYEISKDVFDEIRHLLKPGVYERDIAVELKYLIEKKGGEVGFDPVVCSGRRSALPHARAEKKKLCRGELLVLDFGVRFSGYLSDFTRTFYLGGGLSKKDLEDKMYRVCMEAKNAAIRKARRGVLISDLDRLARSVIDSAGFGRYFIHNLGHGIGLCVHEAPRISKKNRRRLQRGMTITIEPGIYIPEVGGVRLEDGILVEEEGVEVLSEVDEDEFFLSL